MSGRKKAAAAAPRAESTAAAAATVSARRSKSGKTTHGGADDSTGSDDELLLEWVDVTKAVGSRVGGPQFSPRCAHAMTHLPGAGEGGPLAATVAIIGGCNEAEYFPAEEVGRPPARSPCVPLRPCIFLIRWARGRGWGSPRSPRARACCGFLSECLSPPFRSLSPLTWPRWRGLPFPSSLWSPLRSPSTSVRLLPAPVVLVRACVTVRVCVCVTAVRAYHSVHTVTMSDDDTETRVVVIGVDPGGGDMSLSQAELEIHMWSQS